MKNKYFFSFLLAMLMALPSTAQVRQLQVWRGGAIVQSFATTQIDSVTFSVISEPGTGGSTSEPNVYTANGVSFKMIPVEGGTFLMGAPYDDFEAYEDVERPMHSVTLSSYAIGETEVTQELWKAVMGSNPSEFSGNQLPVENVSWDDCQIFITRLNQLTGANFRLPTEAEWEFAARGGKKSLGYKYAGSNTLVDVAWCNDNSSSKTHAVAQKLPNELGLYDMVGNVWEWCQDWYARYGPAAQTNPTGPTTGSWRVYRGASFYNSSFACRVSYRIGGPPAEAYDYVGLRLAQ